MDSWLNVWVIYFLQDMCNIETKSMTFTPAKIFLFSSNQIPKFNPLTQPLSICSPSSYPKPDLKINCNPLSSDSCLLTKVKSRTNVAGASDLLTIRIKHIYEFVNTQKVIYF